MVFYRFKIRLPNGNSIYTVAGGNFFGQAEQAALAAYPPGSVITDWSCLTSP